MLLLKKLDFIIIAVLLIAAGGLYFSGLLRPGSEGTYGVVYVDGKEVQADNFLYNDTTYLPIRAVSEALGKDVQYDNQTSTATISEKKEDDNMAVTSKYTPPAEYINDSDYIMQKDGVYYALLNFVWDMVQDADCKAEYEHDTKMIKILKDKKEIYSCQAILVEDRSVIPYDQFVDEIEPLLK